MRTIGCFRMWWCAVGLLYAAAAVGAFCAEAAAPVRINCGGNVAGEFGADQFFSGGIAGNGTAAVDVSRAKGAAPAGVYQSERWGDFSYAIAGLKAESFYLVRMHFAEIFFNRAGARTFHVTINGTSALSNYDIFKAAGGANIAVVEEFTTKSDKQGVVKLEFKGVVDHAKCSGIEVASCAAPKDFAAVKPLDKVPLYYSPDGTRYLINKEDKDDIFQLYVGKRGEEAVCVSVPPKGGTTNVPKADRHKYMATWHPSGKWIIIGVEKEKHDNAWVPKFLSKGWIECGIWLDIYAVSPDGSKWVKLVETDGFTGVPFTADGKLGAWAKIVDGNVIAHPHFGVWKLMTGEFVEENGVPSFKNVRDISPKGAVFLEPGNFSPDGESLLLTADVGIKDNQGVDQYILNVKTGALKNLTNTQEEWDEHGVFLPDGKQVLFMSSHPYRNDPNAWKTLSLKTEFMIVNVDGTGLRQLTHYNVPGYAESFPKGKGAVAACGMINADGKKIVATSLRFPDYDWWEIEVGK
ncbi:MAG TPA: malectin domain-containing carbohydrate-binding protein [Planctomycetota bacterium]|nr:malectin domain-containing carbohydrate-binding protein [Planctomycetota bacterium]